jgi:23S rRNA pseudouridine955/2504/2580 synthase/23S rRNA pseudouridine1911/1915/1917 synthase
VKGPPRDGRRGGESGRRRRGEEVDEPGEPGVIFLIGREESLDPEDGVVVAPRGVRRKPPRITIIEDAGAWVAVDKPAGLSTTRERFQPKADTALSLLHRLDLAKNPDAPLPKPVHRLDKETSGVVLFARGTEAAAALSEAFRKRRVDKDYLALVNGGPSEPSGEIDVRLSADPGPGKPVRVLRHGGRPSRTSWSVEETFSGYTLLRVIPRTGRTHQVRATLAHLGWPIVGDSLYGGGDGLFLSAIKPRFRAPADHPEHPLLGRVGLHAERLRFADPLAEDPETAPKRSVEAPLPKDFRAALTQLRRWGPAPPAWEGDHTGDLPQSGGFDDHGPIDE